MKVHWPRKRGVWLALVIFLGVATIIASTPTLQESLRGVAMALTGAWRAGGNATLTLDSDIRQGVSKAIDFTNEPYPPNPAADETFYTQTRINDLMGGPATLQRYDLFCGYNTTTGETSRVTNIVFWGQNFWEGTKQTFTCGPATTPTYQVSGTVTSPRSFCIVTDRTPGSRRSRCLNGPRCDDGRRNANESDVDCGGSCGGCAAGRSCNSNSDCANNGTCSSGICRNPSCNDGVKNQNESDVDCGGSCANCPNGRTCSGNGDCQSGNCQGGTCAVRLTCSGAAATSAATDFTVLVNLPNFCGGYVVYFANNFAQAKGCASAAGHSVPSQVCHYEVRMEPNWYTSQYASSPAFAVQCAKNTVCSNCSPVVTNTYSCQLQ